MTAESRIEQFLRGHGVPVSGSIVRDGYDGPRFYVFVEVTRDGNYRQVPSNITLHKLRNKLSEEGTNVEFILTDGAQRDIEISVRASLLHSFGMLVRNSFISTTHNTAEIWLDTKKTLTNDQLAEIKNNAEIMLAHFGLKLGHIQFANADNLPSQTICIVALRKLAPAELSKIAYLLRKNGFTVPSNDWLSRTFDNLRKKGFVVRLKSEKYALSLAGLKALGTAKNAKSPDLSRLLDLARRGE